MSVFFNLDTSTKILFLITAILVVTSIANFLLLIISNRKVKRYKKMYDVCLAKFNSKEDVKDEFTSLYNRLSEVENICENVSQDSKEVREMLNMNIQKIGLVKYNAYDETENKLSFALALLDANENGVLINHIYSKHGSSMYCKLVATGKIQERISEEEATALREASADKGFKQRTTFEADSIKTSKTKTKKSAKKA